MMKLLKYPNKHAKRTHRRVALSKGAFEKLYEVSEEWELKEITGNEAIFIPKTNEGEGEKEK